MSNGFPNAGFRNTPDTAVVPFYLYAAISFLACTILLTVSTESFTQHYFSPRLLAITHGMALGWATMIILGASHQLIPVLTEKSLFSIRLAHFSFFLAAVGIPLLVYGFYTFNMGWPSKWGGRLVLLSVMAYLVNIFNTVKTGKSGNIYSLFIVTAASWLFITAFLGLVLVYNFTYPFLPKDVLTYLPLHAHAGILGWFLMLIIGVGSRLIPMFLISKYQNNRRLKLIFLMINGGLIYYLLSYYFQFPYPVFIAGLMIGTALSFFLHYIFRIWQCRIRKKVDQPMRISLLSVAMMLLPLLIILVVSVYRISGGPQSRLVLLYGFLIFFGWITSLILGMTFKTLPFIIWNKCYHEKAGLMKTPDPKTLMSDRLFMAMGVSYLSGFLVFSLGIFGGYANLLKAGATALILAAVFYNLNVLKIWRHKPML